MNWSEVEHAFRVCCAAGLRVLEGVMQSEGLIFVDRVLHCPLEVALVFMHSLCFLAHPSSLSNL